MNIKHHFGDGLYAKEIHIPAGMMAGKHRHTYTHLSILAKGRVEVRTDNGTGKLVTRHEYTAPACIEIKANVLHQITAIEDSTWFCIHATDEKDPEKVDQVTVMKGRGQWAGS